MFRLYENDFLDLVAVDEEKVAEPPAESKFDIGRIGRNGAQSGSCLTKQRRVYRLRLPRSSHYTSSCNVSNKAAPLNADLYLRATSQVAQTILTLHATASRLHATRPVTRI
eukprot:5831209-Pleurochrysis_carterae.AAC.2